MNEYIQVFILLELIWIDISILHIFYTIKNIEKEVKKKYESQNEGSRTQELSERTKIGQRLRNYFQNKFRRPNE